MPELQVKSSSSPKRCEICHQADLFDIETNTCSRCVNVVVPKPAYTSTKQGINQPQVPVGKVFTNLIGSMFFVSTIVFIFVAFGCSLWIPDKYYQFFNPALTISFLAVIITNFLFVAYIKHKLIEASPDSVRVVPTKLERFPELDIATLNQYTQKLIDLGFQPVADVSLIMEGGIDTPGMARIFLNYEHGCIAEVNQLFPPSQPVTPMRVVFITYFEKDWYYSSTDREPDSVTYMLRKPKRLCVMYKNSNVSDIFQEHLLRVKTTSQGLGCPIIPISSVEEYFSNEEEYSKHIKPGIKDLNLLKGIVQGLIFEYFPKYEWLGDYAKIAKAKARE